MKQGINKVTLVGYVGDNPRVNETKGNGLVANISLATNETYKDKDGKELQKTEWHRIVAWDKRAEILRDYVKKGDALYVEGKLKTLSYEDKEGVKRYSTEIFCDNFLFLSPKNN
ncbi:MAG: single-stranded DNA-binding protein [Bacteroidales bacterium]|nr:single-stranded DNA-binding protein [Bacteroidales bacterium]MCF8389282.1 single-stranded DNA-binding protein [Bacteroidales bacterium]